MLLMLLTRSLFIAGTLTLFWIVGLGFYIILTKNIRFNKLIFSPLAYPIFASLGLSIIITISTLLSFHSVLISFIVIVILVIISSIVLLYQVYSQRNHVFESLKSERNLMFIMLFAVTVLHFGEVSLVLTWPPPGDVANAHAPLVQEIQQLGHIPLSDVNVLSILYPPGFHSLAVILNNLYKLYAPQIVLMLAFALITLVPLLVYTITVLLTNSAIIGLIGYLSVWYVDPSYNLDRFVLGLLYNGVYPFMLALVLALGYIGYTCLPEVKENKHSIMHLPFFFISLLFTYPPLFITIFLATLIYCIKNISKAKIKEFLQTILFFRQAVILWISIIILFCITFYSLDRIIILASYLTGRYSISSQYTFYPSQSEAYMISFKDFLQNLLGRLTFIVAILSTALCLLKLDLSFVEVLFLISMFGIIYPSLLFHQLHKILGIFTPKRLFLLIQCIVFPLMVTSLRKILFCYLGDSKLRLRKRIIKPQKFVTVVITIILILFIGIFFPYFKEHFVLYYAKKLPWNLALSPGFQDDLGALQWIAENVLPGEVVLNEPSWTGRYALSMKFTDVVFRVWGDPYEKERAKDLMLLWISPNEMIEIQRLLEKYNVSYIFLTSESVYIDFIYSNEYQYKIYSSAYLPKIFDSYPFLITEYKSGNTRIYKFMRHLNLYFVTLDRIIINDSLSFWKVYRNETMYLSPYNATIAIVREEPDWGLEHVFSRSRDWFNADYLLIKIAVKSKERYISGLTLKVFDCNGNPIEWLVLLRTNQLVEIFLSIDYPYHKSESVNLHNICKLVVIPDPHLISTGDSLYIKEISAIRLSTKSSSTS